VSTRTSRKSWPPSQPYREWLDRTQMLKDMPRTPSPWHRSQRAARPPAGLRLHPGRHQVPAAPMVQTGQEAIGSMGTDNPPRRCRPAPSCCHTYFKQLFAQVTNPPIDPIREELVMSLVSLIGPRPNLLGLDRHRRHWRLEVQPAGADQRGPGAHPRTSVTIRRQRLPTRRWTSPIRPPTARGHGKGAGTPLRRAEAGGATGHNILILSDRAPTRTTSRSRRCWPPRRCITT
jgi:glutamate synthase (NADPH/NADH) large chain